MAGIKGFVAGALSVLTIMSAAWWLMRHLAFIPANAVPLWSLVPPVPPFGVPRAVNLAFWGGVWGFVLNQLFRNFSGIGYWLAWTAAGAVAVAGCALFVVPMIKANLGASLAWARIAMIVFMVAGLVFIALLDRLPGTAMWPVWLAAGVIAAAALAVLLWPVVASGQIPSHPPQRLMLSGFLNGMFGLGTAIWIVLLGRGGRDAAEDRAEDRADYGVRRAVPYKD